MTKNTAYMIPSDTATAEQLISKSRFIAAVGHADSKKAAMSFIENVKDAHPGAHHYTYGYIAGSPASSSELGFSDDGEVSGTAGKPILSILQHKGIGDVVAVVTRFYGGTKLGTGGLVRAYSGTLMLALDKLRLSEYSKMLSATTIVPYQYESPLRVLFEKNSIVFNEPLYSEDVTISTELPENIADDIKSEIMNLTRGQARIEIIDS